MNRPGTQMSSRARPARAVGVVLIGCAVLVAGIGVDAEATVRRSAEDALVRRVNHARADAGLAELKVDFQLTRAAREWTGRMARRRRLSHNPDLRSRVHGSWGRLGENVGYTRRADASQSDLVRELHRSFMGSPGHRANVLGKFDRIGVGVQTTSDRTMWTTVVFGQGSGAPLFPDAAGLRHEGAINQLWRDGVVTGCRRDRFCPAQPLTRAQLATMLVGAVDGVSPGRGMPFSDVRAGHPHAAGIAALAAEGASSGCAGGRFCPNRPVTRAQLAAMLLRAVDGLGRAAPSFRDMGADAAHAHSIGGVVAAGVARGCGNGRFCPEEPVTRAQAATVIERAARR